MLVGNPAWASFGDCNDPAYLAHFDPSLTSAHGFLCVESDRLAVTSEAGTTHIRIIQHLVADWATRPGALRAIKNGVAASVRAMGTLGSFRISDVTILLIDGFAPGGGSERFGDIAAGTNFSPGDECHIAVWLLGPGATAGYGANCFTVSSDRASRTRRCVPPRAEALREEERGGSRAPPTGFRRQPYRPLLISKIAYVPSIPIPQPSR